jgi:hypothetical protein
LWVEHVAKSIRGLSTFHAQNNYSYLSPCMQAYTRNLSSNSSFNNLKIHIFKNYIYNPYYSYRSPNIATSAGVL